MTLIFLLPFNAFSWDDDFGDEEWGDEEFSDDFSGDSGGLDGGMDTRGFAEEKPSGSNRITGEKILKAAQRHGMTDNELRYFLKSTNPDLNVKDQKFGANALIHASINNRPNMVLMLLEVGDMAIDATDYNGETALIGAARHCHQKVIDILLEYSADKTIMGKFKKTAFDYAAQNCSQSFAKNIGGPSGKQLSSISAIVKAKSAFKRKKRPSRGGGGSISTAQGKRALNDIVKIKGILDYMDKYKNLNPKVEKNNFDKMAKVVGIWPDINKKKLQRAAEEEKRKQQMKRNLAQKKKRAMTKLRTMGFLRKGGTDYRARMEELERKKKIDNIIAEKENEIIIEADKEKEKDIKEGMKRKRRAINLIIFSGTRGKNINSLKNEKEDVIIRKWQSIKELLDAEEGRYESMAKLKMARKKSQAISRFKMGGKQFRITMNKLALEERKAKERAEKEARLAAERKRIELENKLKREKERLLAELNRKEKALQDALKREEERRLAEEKRRKALEEKLKNERGPVMVIGDERPDSSIVKIDEKTKTIVTNDFRLNFLKSRNCQIRKRTNGTYFLFVLTYKASNIKQSGRNNAIWFINRSAKSVGEMGGKKCPRSSCKDFAIYHSGGVRKDLFMSNLTVELGRKPKDHFEIYSSRASNPVIKVSVKECKNFPKR
jgi:hypothetical protein